VMFCESEPYIGMLRTLCLKTRFVHVFIHSVSNLSICVPAGVYKAFLLSQRLYLIVISPAAHDEMSSA
jgi:hypothetical protein